MSTSYESLRRHQIAQQWMNLRAAGYTVYSRPLVPFAEGFLPKLDSTSFAPASSILKFDPDLRPFPDDLKRAASPVVQAEKELCESQEKIDDLKVKISGYRYDMGREDEINDELAKLEARQQILRDDTMNKRSKFITAAITHSQKCCQDLSKKIVRSLPREIRDMIYGYLCDRVLRVSISPSEGVESIQWLGSKSREEAITSGWRYIDRIETPLPQLFSTKYLQKEFVFELASVLYQKATFHIWDASDIDDFLHEDLLRVGCVPRDHVRKLSLVVFTDAYDQRCSSKRQIQKKVSQLEHLHELKHYDGFQLDLHLCISKINHHPLVARFFQILLPYLLNMKAANFAMRFPLRKYYYGKNRKSIGSESNQLQASRSRDPEDWVVDDDELEAWKESKLVQNAFKRSALMNPRFYEDEDEYMGISSGSSIGTGEEDLDSDFEDCSVASDDSCH